MFHYDLIGLSQFAVAAHLGCEIDNDAAFLHGFDHGLCYELGGWSAGNECCGDDDINFFGLLGKEFHFGLDKLITHDLGIAALSGSVLICKIEHQELCIHTLDLFLYFRAGIKGSDNGPHAFSSTDC